MKIKKKHIFRFFGPFFSSFIIFGWDFVENEKNHQKSTVILLQFWLSKQKNYFWSHAKLAKMSSFQCTVPPPAYRPRRNYGGYMRRLRRLYEKLKSLLWQSACLRNFWKLSIFSHKKLFKNVILKPKLATIFFFQKCCFFLKFFDLISLV